jgi:hypothetical protein
MPVMTKISPKITQKKEPTNSLVGKQQNKGIRKANPVATIEV